jgi:hypothetical protein
MTGPLKNYSASTVSWIPSLQIFFMMFCVCYRKTLPTALNTNSVSRDQSLELSLIILVHDTSSSVAHFFTSSVS